MTEQDKDFLLLTALFYASSVGILALHGNADGVAQVTALHLGIAAIRVLWILLRRRS